MTLKHNNSFAYKSVGWSCLMEELVLLRIPNDVYQVIAGFISKFFHTRTWHLAWEGCSDWMVASLSVWLPLGSLTSLCGTRRLAELMYQEKLSGSTWLSLIFLNVIIWNPFCCSVHHDTKARERHASLGGKTVKKLWTCLKASQALRWLMATYCRKGQGRTGWERVKLISEQLGLRFLCKI